jgi:hypothetical protein
MKNLRRVVALLLVQVVFAAPLGAYMMNPEDGVHKGHATVSRIKALGNFTFIKDFSALPIGEVSAALLKADYSVGDGTATPAWSTTSSTRTYVDGTGLIQIADTVNTLRVKGGYYDSTGFHAQKGLMMERARTNLSQDPYFADGTTTYWQALVGGGGTGAFLADATYTNLYGGGQIVKFTGTKAGDAFVTDTSKFFAVTAGQKYTGSMLLRGSGTVQLFMVDGNGNHINSGVDITLTAGWSFHQYAFTSITSGANGGIGVKIAADNAVTCYMSTIQMENAPYATSFIPGALTRNAESLSYLNAGNRTAATESVFLKLAYNHSPETTLLHAILDSDTKRRVSDKGSGDTVFEFCPNYTDNPAVLIKATTTPVANTSYVVGFTMAATGNPNATIYMDGTEEAHTDSDFTSPAWGDNFYLGNKYNATYQLDGIIQFFGASSDVKVDTDVLKIVTLLAA